MRIDAALARAVETLGQTSESPKLDAEVLLARALDLPKSYLYAHPEDELDDAAMERFFSSVERRRTGLPLAYITGTKEFWSLPLLVTGDVLVPRPETELLVELALRHIPRRGECAALDLGTGSGAIAVALASERPGCRIVATDASAAALAVARENARRLGLGNVEFREGDWTAPLAGTDAGRFDLVVSNPPYIGRDEPELADLRHEPSAALVAGKDGLDAIRVLARDCPPLLAPGGLMLLEHGAAQRERVAGILAAEGWREIRCYEDAAGLPRVTSAAVRLAPS